VPLNPDSKTKFLGAGKYPKQSAWVHEAGKSIGRQVHLSPFDQLMKFFEWEVQRLDQ
jgi:hypothetical protein